MVGFPNDALEAECCHGDLSLQFCSNTADTNIHALRDIVKNLPDLLLVRWKQEGSVPPQAPVKPGVPAQSARNFLGFRDGSANPDSNDAKAMDQIVWVQPGSDEPAWATHGSYQAVRIIRNFVERWDRTPLQEQESIIGRVKTTGAPMGAHHETEVPDYSKDPQGKLTKLDAHIRLANPRTAASQANLILRRPFNYSNGVNKNGQLDMGLLFICYQADLEKASSPCRPGSTASRLRSTSNRSAAVTSSPFRVSPATRTSSVARCLTPPNPKQLPNHKKPRSRSMKKSPLALLLTLGLLNTPLSAFAATAPLDLVGPVSDYKIYVSEQLDELGSHTKQFTDAVKKAICPPRKSSTRRPASTTSRSNRLPSCSVTLMRPSTRASTTTKRREG